MNRFSLRRRVQNLERKMESMAGVLDDLRAEVAREKDVAASAKKLIVGLVQKIEAAGGDQDQIRQIIADIKANNDDLAKAVTENTPFNPSANAG